VARKCLAKVVHLYAGLDLIGSKTSVSNRDAEIEVTLVGMVMTSRKTKKVILLPWSNIKGAELMPETVKNMPDEVKKIFEPLVA
jgi:hypothetical protein